jgi:hypothetical protein
VRKADRVLLLLLAAAVMGLAWIAFGPIIRDVVLRPLSEALWYVLRVFVLSVDQALLWGFLLLGLGVFVALRLAARLMARAEAPARAADAGGASRDPNAALSDLKYWRYLLAETPRDARERSLAQRELARLLLSAYASAHRVEANFELYGDLREGRIALPGGLRPFLFGEESKKGTKLQAWLRRVSGRDRADYRRSVEEYFDYLESVMEIRDDGK